MGDRDVAATFLWWTGLRAVCHRGWWLVTSLYLVVVADLLASELVLYGAVMALTMVLAEIPTGVVADAISRKWSLVIAHLVMGTGMVITGLVTAFPLFLVAQVFWGLGWTFSSGAEVAWITDELDRPGRIDRLLAARARWEQVGAACGLVGFGALGWAAGLGPAVVLAGVGMLALGLVVAWRFTEHNFAPTRARRWQASVATFQRGVSLARRDREIMVVLAATFLVNGGGTAFAFLFPKRLLDLGFPANPAPIVWFTLLGLATLAVAALALRLVEARIDGAHAARRDYAAAALAGALGLVLLAAAPEDVTGIAAVLLVRGISEPVTRAVATIWVNRRVTSDVRATVHSFLSQAETSGEVLVGVALAGVAGATGMPPTFAVAALLFAGAGVLVARSRAASASQLEAAGD